MTQSETMINALCENIADSYMNYLEIESVPIEEGLKVRLEQSGVKRLDDIDKKTLVDLELSWDELMMLTIQLDKLLKSSYYIDVIKSLVADSVKDRETEVNTTISEIRKVISDSLGKNSEIETVDIENSFKPRLQHYGVKRLSDVNRESLINADFTWTELMLLKIQIERFATSVRQEESARDQLSSILKNPDSEVNMMTWKITKALANSPRRNLDIKMIQIEDDLKTRLKQNGIKRLGDINRKSLLDARLKWGELISLELQVKRLMGNSYYFENLISMLSDRLDDRELEIIHKRYGLTEPKLTLAEVGELLGVTRERVRQIEATAIDKARTGIWRLHPEVYYQVEELVSSGAYADDFERLSKYYRGGGLMRIISDLYEDTFTIYRSERLKSPLLIKNEDKDEFNKRIDSAIKLLMIQENYVPIKAVAKEVSLKEKIIRDFKDSEIDQNHIALKANKAATGIIGVIKRVLSRDGGPLTVEEITKRSNLSENQVRGYLDKYKQFVNIGQSTYALEGWGYIHGTTSDIIAHYLDMSTEPMTTKEIRSLVYKQRDVTEGTISAALASDRFKRVGYGLYALSSRDEFEEVRFETESYDVSANDAVLSVLEDMSDLVQHSEIVNAIFNKFGEKASTKPVTIYAALRSLTESGEIIKVKKRSSAYFKLPD